MQVCIWGQTQQLLTICLNWPACTILMAVSNSEAVILSNLKRCLRPNWLSSHNRVSLSRGISQFARTDALRYCGLMTPLASSKCFCVLLLLELLEGTKLFLTAYRTCGTLIFLHSTKASFKLGQRQQQRQHEKTMI